MARLMREARRAERQVRRDIRALDRILSGCSQKTPDLLEPPDLLEAPDPWKPHTPMGALDPMGAPDPMGGADPMGAPVFELKATL